MKNYFKGKTYLKIESGSPYYVTGGSKRDRCLKKVINLRHYSVALRVTDSKEFNEKYKKKLLKVFDKIDGMSALKGTQVYYLDSMLWILKMIDDVELTKNPQVIYNRKLNKYFGYSHRAVQSFGPADMLFDLENEDKEIYYKSKKYRKKIY